MNRDLEREEEEWREARIKAEEETWPDTPDSETLQQMAAAKLRQGVVSARGEALDLKEVERLVERALKKWRRS